MLTYAALHSLACSPGLGRSLKYRYVQREGSINRWIGLSSSTAEVELIRDLMSTSRPKPREKTEWETLKLLLGLKCSRRGQVTKPGQPHGIEVRLHVLKTGDNGGRIQRLSSSLSISVGLSTKDELVHVAQFAPQGLTIVRMLFACFLYGKWKNELGVHGDPS